MIIGQQQAGLAQGINAMDLLGALVVEQIAIRLLLIRQHLHQDDATGDGIPELRIIQGLIFVLHGVGVDAFARGRVVFHLDGEVAIDRLHKDPILNANMRMQTFAIHLSACALPLNLMLRREDKLVVKAIAQVLERGLILLDEPLEGLHLGGIATRLHHHEEMRPGAVELQEGRVLVVLVVVSEVLQEGGIIQAALALGVKGMIARLVVIHREHILHPHGGAEAEMDVVAKEKPAGSNGDHVARDAVVLRGQSRRGDQREIDATEDGLAIRIELLHPGGEFSAVLGQALANDLIGPGFELGLGRCDGIRHGGSLALLLHGEQCRCLFVTQAKSCDGSEHAGELVLDSSFAIHG